GRADGCQVAELATPLRRRDIADPGGKTEDIAADRGSRADAGRPGADQVAQPFLNLLVAIGNQLLLGREVVVDGLLGHLGLARHVSDGDMLITVLREKPGRGIRDMPASPLLLELAQPDAGHASYFSGGTRKLGRTL